MMNAAKTIEETIQAVCVASPLYRGYRIRRALAGYAVLALVCAVIYLCWHHWGEIVGGLWALVSRKSASWSAAPAAQWFLWLILCLFAAVIVYEALADRKNWPAVRDGKATDDLLVAIVQNPHIQQSAKASLASEIEQHGYVSAAALGEVAARADREAVVKKRQAEIQRARFELGPGATAMLNYRQSDEQAGGDA